MKKEIIRGIELYRLNKFYRVTCKDTKTKLFNTRAVACDYAKTLRARGFENVNVQIRHSLSRKKTNDESFVWIDAKLPEDKLLIDANDTEVYTYEINRLIRIFHRSRKTLENADRRVISEHLKDGSGPVTKPETPKETDPEVYNEEKLIKPLLRFLGYREILPHSGNGKSDILLRFDDKCIVVESKPLNVYGFPKYTNQTVRYIEADKEKGCIGGILTDGGRWMLIASAGDEQIRSEVFDFREMLGFIISGRNRKEDIGKYIGQMKQFISIFSADTVVDSFNSLCAPEKTLNS